MASFISQPFKATYRFAYDRPAYFWSLVIGFVGPVYVLVMPPIQRKYGRVKPESIPYTYPMPNRPRRPTVGYEDP
ncbi:2502_t:CDS:2 [Ambispora leptoticha]|uniref:2502_t:CDS:1 n=1 Tax=Ambispora leptoticha TaxID=144679 RepID=A0A9N8ZX31_9GLOM|nr:2502_t:CDS:2 [Ambispora leptoticha]